MLGCRFFKRNELILGNATKLEMARAEWNTFFNAMRHFDVSSSHSGACTATAATLGDDVGIRPQICRDVFLKRGIGQVNKNWDPKKPREGLEIHILHPERIVSSYETRNEASTEEKMKCNAAKIIQGPDGNKETISQKGSTTLCPGCHLHWLTWRPAALVGCLQRTVLFIVLFMVADV